LLPMLSSNINVVRHGTKGSSQATVYPIRPAPEALHTESSVQIDNPVPEAKKTLVSNVGPTS